MLQRTFTIFLTAMREAARSSLAWLGALALLAAVPLATLVLGDSETGARVWLSRSLVSEGLRWLLPVAALAGAAYVIRPTIKRGWVCLPARRAEWFLASSLAAFVSCALAATLLVGGGVLASMAMSDAGQLEVTATAQTLARVGSRNDSRATNDERLFVFPNGRETLEFEFDGKDLGETLQGKLQFEIGWMGEIAPDRNTPFEVRVIGDSSFLATTHVEARRRATFEAKNPGGQTIRVVCRGIDPALSVGMKRSECKLVLRHEPALTSLLLLAGAGLCGALLCVAITLCVRSLSTAPTAALAGALVFAALTLLPAMGAGDFAARKRREAVEGGQNDGKSTAQSLAETLSGLPPLIEPTNFERVLSGEAATSSDADAALLRLLVALGLLPLGAVLFTRREIA